MVCVWVSVVCGSDGAKHAGVESASHEGVTVALRVAFFLGNLPVALSSSIVMLENGMSRIAIFLMWLLLTGTRTGREARETTLNTRHDTTERNSQFAWWARVNWR